MTDNGKFVIIRNIVNTKETGIGDIMRIMHLNKKQIIIGMFFGLLLAGWILLCLGLEKDETASYEEVPKGKVFFSVEPGFYNQSIDLELTATSQGTILYTTDGSVPSAENENALVYVSGIHIKCLPREKVNTIKAVLIPQEETLPQEVCTATYIVGDSVKTRYSTAVLSLTGEASDLLDEQTGIFALVNRNEKGEEYEKPVQITLFDKNGNLELSQNGGVRMHGCYSRGKNQPSMKLYARSEYDEKKDFNCILFEDYTEKNAIMTGLKRVIVRSGGGDNGYAHLRSEFASEISSRAGFQDTQASSPVCVYINGEYYGVYWFVEAYDDSYFEKKYGKYDGQMVVMEGVVAALNPEEDDDELTLSLKEEYNNLYAALAYADLKDENNWNSLNASVDVKNFMQYMAIQNYISNADVLVNNFKVYRYYSPEGEYRDGTVFDGRYRFLLYDMDESLGFGTYEGPVTGAENIMSNTNRINYDIFYNALFTSVLGRKEERDDYVRYYLALLNYYFSPEYAGAVLDEMHKSRSQELRYMYSQSDLMKDNLDTPEDVDYSHVIYELEKIKTFLVNRQEWCLLDLKEAFGLNNIYTLNVQNPGHANISVDYATFSDTEFTGRYFTEVPAILTAVPRVGEKFEYWLVDGVEYEEPVLTLTGDLLKDDTLYVECVVSLDTDIGLQVTAVKSRGGNDYMELTNFGLESEDLAEYMLADGSHRSNLSNLPSVEVAPGETIRVYCKDYTGAEAIGKPQVKFNLKAGEVVHLYHQNLIQKVDVPRLGTKDGIYRMDLQTGEFFERTE